MNITTDRQLLLRAASLTGVLPNALLVISSLRHNNRDILTVVSQDTRHNIIAAAAIPCTSPQPQSWLEQTTPFALLSAIAAIRCPLSRELILSPSPQGLLLRAPTAQDHSILSLRPPSPIPADNLRPLPPPPQPGPDTLTVSAAALLMALRHNLLTGAPRTELRSQPPHLVAASWTPAHLCIARIPASGHRIDASVTTAAARAIHATTRIATPATQLLLSHTNNRLTVHSSPTDPAMPQPILKTNAGKTDPGPPPIPDSFPITCHVPAPPLRNALNAIPGPPNPGDTILLTSRAESLLIDPPRPVEATVPLHIPASGDPLQTLRVPLDPLRHILSNMHAPSLDILADPSAPFRLLVQFQDRASYRIRHLLLLPAQPAPPTA